MYIKQTGCRRDFLKQLAAFAGISLTAVACKPDLSPHIGGRITGANAGRGHLLRDHAQLPPPTETINTRVLIAGSGIAGMSARRWLEQNHIDNVLMLELDDKTGGNSAYGKNEVSAYPLGAHYLPVPDIRNKELISFLEQAGVIVSFNESGLPVYNDYHLCHDPQERLFINGYWQEGLVPDFGVPEREKEQIRRFFSLMERFKAEKGKDGKDAFAIPVDHSSQDTAYTSLDGISFREWLHREGFDAPHLLWYLEYGCKDDYGCRLAETSAWAGIHYFASRKGKGANAGSSGVLTWPEGNGFLMSRLQAQARSEIKKGWLLYEVHHTERGVRALAYDAKRNLSVQIMAEKLLLATPQYVNKHLLKHVAAPERTEVLNGFQYAPWAVANMVVNSLPPSSGQPLCWDNVFYGTPSVGYVNANQQDLSGSLKKVLTFYLPVAGKDFQSARRLAYERSYRDWQDLILQEMNLAHNGIAGCIEHMDIQIWGHGMIAPVPGFIWGAARSLAKAPVNNVIFFAHSDLGGVSIFEEAFYQGIRAATDIIRSL